MLKKIFGKLIGIFLLVLAILIILFIGLNIFFNWKNYQYNDAKLKVLKNKDEYKEAERENRQSELEKKQIEQIERQLAGFQPKPKDTEPLSWCKDGYLGIKGIDESKNTIQEGEDAVLIYTEEQKKHFVRIIEDIDDFLNNDGKLNLEVEGESSKKDQWPI